MKKNKILLMLVVFLGIGLASCGETNTDSSNNESDVNNGVNYKINLYNGSENWDCDEEGHWLKSDSDGSKNKSLHCYGSKESTICSKCGYVSSSLSHVLYTINSDGESYSASLPSIRKTSEVDSAIIESYINGKPVTKIADNAFKNYNNLLSVYIPNTITSIGYDAFRNCKSLNTIVLPNSLKEIKYNAFYDCSALTSINIPSSIEKIEQNAFKDCVKLVSVTNSSSLNISIGSKDNGLVAYNALEVIKSKNESNLSINDDGFALYKNDDDLMIVSYLGQSKDITTPLEATSIRKYAFCDLFKLNSVNIGDNITSLEDYAFYNCTSLTSAILGNGIKELKKNTFLGCTLLSNLSFPDSLEIIEDGFFDNRYKFKSTGEDGLYYYGNDSNPYLILNYVNKDIEGDVKVNEKTKIIYTGAFADCTKIERIELPSSIVTIGENAFENCKSLSAIYVNKNNTNFYSDESGILYNYEKTKIIIVPKKVDGDIFLPDTITSIDDYQFESHDLIRTVSLGDKVTSIGEGAFKDCLSLKSIDLPEGLESIKVSTFENCYSLYSINIPSTVIAIEDGAFSNCVKLLEVINKSKLVIMKGSSDFGGVALNAKSVISNEEESIFSTSKDGFVTYLDELTYLITYIGNETDITIPDNVEGIFKYCFYNDTRITSVKFSNSVTILGESAFSYCTSLNFVYLSNKISIISNSTFRHCEALTSLYIPKSVVYFGEDAFSYCLSLVGIEIPNNLHFIGSSCFYGCQSLKSIDIPESVTILETCYLFSDCPNLKSVTLPSSVTKIDKFAFGGCTNLRNLEIPENVTSIELCAFYECQSLYTINIPSKVEEIGVSAFEDCKKLIEVVNESSLNITCGSDENGYVGKWAKQVINSSKRTKLTKDEDDFVFYRDGSNNLLVSYDGYNTNVTTPNSATSIYDYAFYGQFDLKSINIASGAKSIGEKAFYECESLETIKIANSVTSVGKNAFYYCLNISTIVMTNSIKEIGDGAFNSTADGSVVYFVGTSSDREVFRKSTNNYGLIEAKWYYYSESKPSESDTYWHYVDGVPTVWQVN